MEMHNENCKVKTAKWKCIMEIANGNCKVEMRNGNYRIKIVNGGSWFSTEELECYDIIFVRNSSEQYLYDDPFCTINSREVLISGRCLHIAWYVLHAHVIGGKCRNTTYDLVLKDDCYAHSVLYSPTTNTVRPLTILTDTWCSAGQFVSDGSLVQTGGGYECQQKVRWSILWAPFSSGCKFVRAVRGPSVQVCTW